MLKQTSPAANRPEVLVLQGGGALGSYQAGVYEALHGAGVEPDWLAGVSIGAVNAALIAGNPPDRRIERLREFWHLISSELVAIAPADEGPARKLFNQLSAATVAAVGTPGFFRPRMPPFAFPGLCEPLSLYDTAPLHDTLLELVDFRRLNESETRFSVGAVNVLTGNLHWFDNRDMEIGPQHIMASGALPPGFPPVMIDGEPYWDGGIVSNTPLQYVLDEAPRCDMTVFQVDLFSARGPMPSTVSESLQREKDIRYSSRTRLNTDQQQQMEDLRLAAARLVEKLPEELRNDPDAQTLAALPRPGAVCVMHLINRSEEFETQSKDYEFSRATVNGHWSTGRRDAEFSLGHAEWEGRSCHEKGVVTFDLTDPRGARIRPRQSRETAEAGRG